MLLLKVSVCILSVWNPCDSYIVSWWKVTNKVLNTRQGKCIFATLQSDSLPFIFSFNFPLLFFLSYLIFYIYSFCKLLFYLPFFFSLSVVRRWEIINMWFSVFLSSSPSIFSLSCCLRHFLYISLSLYLSQSLSRKVRCI